MYVGSFKGIYRIGVNVSLRDSSFYFRRYRATISCQLTRFGVQGAGPRRTSRMFRFFRRHRHVSSTIRLVNNDRSYESKASSDREFSISFVLAELCMPFAGDDFGSNDFVFAGNCQYVRARLRRAALFARYQACATNRLQGVVNSNGCLVDFFPFSLMRNVLRFQEAVPRQAYPVTRECPAIRAPQYLRLSLTYIRHLFRFARIRSAIICQAMSNLLSKGNRGYF